MPDEFSEDALIAALTPLGEYLNHVVVCGSWTLFIYRRWLLKTAATAPVRTLDVDLAVPKKLPVLNEPLCKQLKSAHFRGRGVPEPRAVTRSASGRAENRPREMRTQDPEPDRRPEDEVIASRNPIPTPAAAPKQASPIPSADPITEQQRVALDAQTRIEDRVQAFNQLRRWPSGRSSEVVCSMLALLANGPEAKVQAMIVRAMKGINDPAVKEMLVARAIGDPDAEVREESAECLVTYKQDSSVLQLLQRISKEDVSERVRKQAQESIDK